MIKSKKVKIAILILLILVVGAVAVMGFFSLQNKEFSFQNLKKSDIKEIAINIREVFYYTLDEAEIDTIYKLIKEIHPEGSGEEESEYGSRKIRLTLKNGEKIVFQGEGHVLSMGNRRYYAEGNGLDNLNQYCDSLIVSLNSGNKTRADFSDLKEKTVRNIKVYEGISLCYKLDKEERQEVLNLLNTLELQRLQRVQDKEVEKRYQIEKEDGTIVEFFLDGQAPFVVNGEGYMVKNKEIVEKLTTLSRQIWEKEDL